MDLSLLLIMISQTEHSLMRMNDTSNIIIITSLNSLKRNQILEYSSQTLTSWSSQIHNFISFKKTLSN